jgi:hypothetical protein
MEDNRLLRGMNDWITNEMRSLGGPKLRWEERSSRKTGWM